MLKQKSPGSLLFAVALFFILALIINLALFYGIMQMVTNEQFRQRYLDSINLIDFIRLKEETQDIEEMPDEQLSEPTPPDEPPPPPEIQEPSPDKPQTAPLEFEMPALDVPLSIEGTPYLGDFSKSTRSQPTTNKTAIPGIATNLMPTIKIPPQYPIRALRSGIEGIVTVEFTINTDGSVKDPVIIKADPPKIFNREVLKIIVKWKFNPQLEAGVPVERRARQDIRFRLKK